MATAGSGSGELVLTASVTGTAALTKWQYVKKAGESAWETRWTDVDGASTSLSHTLTGLADGTAYRFKVRARNASGAGAASDASDAATPRAPTLTAGAATAIGLTLTIGGHDAAWHWKQTAPSVGDCSSEVAAGTKTAEVTGLESNTAWTFKAYGNGTCTTELAAASPVATLPGKPAKPAVTVNLGSGKARLTSSVTGTAALTKWQYRKKAGLNAWEPDWTDVDGASTSLSHEVTGLSDDTTYRFMVRAENASGAGAASDESSPAASRSQVLTLTAGAATADGLTLTIGNWSAAWRWKRTAPSAGDCSAEVAAGTDSATVGSLTPNTAWTFKAYSDRRCAIELVTSPPAPTLPPKPAKPAVTVDLGDGKVRLASSVTGPAALTKWQYKKKKDGGNYDADWTDISSTSSSLSPHGERADRRLGLRVQGPGAQRLGLRRGVGRLGRGHPAGGDLDGGHGDGDRDDADRRQLVGGVALEVHHAGGRAMLLGGGGRDEDRDGGEPRLEHRLDVQGVQRQQLRDRAGRRVAGRDPAAAAGEADPDGGPGRRQGEAGVVGDGYGGVDQVAVQEEEGRRQLRRRLDGHLQHLEDPVAHGERADRRLGVQVQGARAQRLGLRRGVGRVGRGHPRAVTLTAGTVTATGMTLTIANWSGAWRWKRTAPSAGDCSSEVAAGTKTATVGSLDSNTAWTFKAYSDNSCGTELAAASPVATLPPKPAKPAVTAGSGSGELVLASSVTGPATLTKWQYAKKEGENAWETGWTDIDSASTSLSHTLTGLTNDTSYRFKVRARNASGAGADSDASDAATPQTLSLVASAATATGMTLTIAGHNTAWYYEYAVPAGGGCSTEVAAGTDSATVGSLKSNTAYTFKAYSDSQCTIELATAAPRTTLPPQPAKPAVTVSLGSGTVRLASSVTGTAPLTKWQYVKKEGENAWETQWRDIDGTSTSLSHTLTGLTDGTAYLFKVRARNASGTGADSDASDAVTPRAPTLAASAATATGMTLTIANWSGAWYYEHATPAGGDCSTEVAAGTSTATPGSLDSNTAYTFKAYGDSQCTTELAAASSLTTLPPKPAKPAATAGAGSGKLTLTASVTGTAALTKWQYKKKEGENAWDDDWTDVDSTSSSLSLTLTGLTDGTAYRFKVRARNASGEGAESDVSDAATPRAPTLTASAATASGMTLTIGNWSGAWRYKYTTPSGGQCSSEVAAGTDPRRWGA